MSRSTSLSNTSYIDESFGWLGTIYSGSHVPTVSSSAENGELQYLHTDEETSWYDGEAGEWHYDDKEVGTFKDDPTIRIYV